METTPQIEAGGTPPDSAAQQVGGATPEPSATPDGSGDSPRQAGGRLAGAQQGWPGSLAVFGVCSALLIWAFWSEISAAVQVWSTSRTFGHAFFIFPITLFLFYRLRFRLAALRPKVAPLAFVPIAGFLLCWVVGELANTMVVKQLAFVGLWQSLFLLVLGWQVTRTAIFPLAYLILAVPFGYSVIPTLQDATAQMVVHLLRFTGMPVFLDGYYIQIPSGAFLVAEACSGVRYLMVSIALGILAANLFFHSWWRRLLFVGLSLVVPVAANGVRAYGIVMLAHLSDYQLAVDVDHIFYGFIFLAMVTLTLLGLAALLRDRYDTLLSDSPGPAPATGTVAGRGLSALGLPGQALFGGIAIGIIVLAQIWTATAKAPPDTLAVTLLAPSAEPAWTTVSVDAPAWSPEFRGVDATLHQGYRQGDSQIDLYVAYYAFQREGAEAINDANALINEGSRWKKIGFNQFKIDLSGQPFAINRVVAQSKGDTYIVWSWYWIGGENTNSRLAGKLLEMKAIATGGERAAAVVAISSKVSEDAAATDALLEAFLRHSIDRNGSLVQIGGSPVADEADLPAASIEIEGETPKP